MKIKTQKRTKTTSIVSVNNENWGILSDKILYFYNDKIDDFDFSESEANKLLEEIKKSSWNKLLDYLAFQERSLGECEEFLKHKIFLKKELQNQLLEKAISLKFIDDDRFTELYIEDLIGKFKSKQEIKNKLFNKKIDGIKITNLLEKIYTPQIASEILDTNFQKAKSRFSNVSNKGQNEKILNYLTRKGFSYWEIKEKLGE